MQAWGRFPVIWRWLGLTAIVLGFHLWLLNALPFPSPTGVSPLPKALLFATRTVESPAAQPTLADATPQSAPIAPERPVRPKPAPKAALPEPAPAPSAEPQPDRPLEPLPEIQQVTAQAATNVVAPPNPARVPPASDTPGNLAAANTSLRRPDSTPPSGATQSAKLWQVNPELLSASTRLVYQIHASRFPYRLAGELLWRNDGTRYNALLRYSALGLKRMQTSRGQITGQGLAPERFSDKYRSEVAAHFNYPQAKVTFSANTPDAPLLAGAQDRLSVLIQLGAILASNPDQAQAGNTLSIQTVGARAADVWVFTVATTEILDLPGGTVDGIKLERLPREMYDQKVEVWLSPQLGYLPARVRITEANGDSIDQRWETSEPIEAAQKADL